MEQFTGPWCEGVESAPALLMTWKAEPYFAGTWFLCFSSTQFTSLDSNWACRGFFTYTHIAIRMACDAQIKDAYVKNHNHALHYHAITYHLAHSRMRGLNPSTVRSCSMAQCTGPI